MVEENPNDDPIGNICGLEACPKLNPPNTGIPKFDVTGASWSGFCNADARSVNEIGTDSSTVFLRAVA